MINGLNTLKSSIISITILLILIITINYSKADEFQNLHKEKSDWYARVNLCNASKEVNNKIFVWRINDTICFFGAINELSKEQFIKLNPFETEWIVVDSEGGRVDSALDISDIIFENNMNLIVWKFCISSCANYFFTAARHKVILEDSYVAWHGGPPRVPPPGSSDTLSQTLRDLVIRNDKFFEKVGVDGSLIFTPPPKSKVTRDEHGVYSFWMNTQVDLESIYHIRNILYMWTDKMNNN
jgi:hypothetical protein